MTTAPPPVHPQHVWTPEPRQRGYTVVGRDGKIEQMIEEWRPVPGFEGYYSVSSEGRIRRDKAAPHTRPGLILKPRLNHSGYLQVGLRRDGQRKVYAPIHRWLARAFLGEPPADKQWVNHKDGNKLNNVPSNIEWCDVSENTLHAIRTGLYASPKLPPMYGEKNPSARLTSDLVRAIRKESGTLGEIAAKYGIGTSQAWRIKRGQSWKEVV